MSEFFQTYRWLGQHLLAWARWNVRFAALAMVFAFGSISRRFRRSQRASTLKAILIVEIPSMLLRASDDIPITRYPWLTDYLEKAERSRN